MTNNIRLIPKAQDGWGEKIWEYVKGNFRKGFWDNNLFNPNSSVRKAFRGEKDKPTPTWKKRTTPKSKPSMKLLPYGDTFRFIRHLENPNDKGIKDGKAKAYDGRTAGWGTDYVSGHPELASKIKSGKWTRQEAMDLAVIDMRKHDLAILLAFKETGLTNRPDTIGLVPRVLMALARYHYGNIKESFPEWGKAVIKGDDTAIKSVALKLAEKYPDRYNRIKLINIYGKNPQIKGFNTK